MLQQERHFATLVLLSADDVEKRRCDGAEGFPHCDPQLDWHCDRDEENQTSNQLTVISSEGALYVIVPYDYPAAQRPLFEHTPVLNNNFEY